MNWLKQLLVFRRRKTDNLRKSNLDVQSMTDRELRDIISVGRLKVDFSNRIIEKKEFGNHDKQIFSIIEILTKYYTKHNLIAFEKILVECLKSDNTLFSLVQFYSELPNDDYQTEILIKVIEFAKPNADTHKLFQNLTEDRQMRIHLRKIEQYMVKNHKELDAKSFNKCVEDWELAERNATQSAFKIMSQLYLNSK